MTSIGFIRFNNELELDYERSSPKLRGTDIRLGMFEAMVDQGHDITIYTRLKPDHVSLLDGVEQGTFGSYGDGDEDEGIEYGFLNHVSYEPKERYPDDDVLMIECAATNSTFAYRGPYPVEYKQKFGKLVPYIWRTFDLIDNFEGHVMYLQHNLDLGFPFYEATREPSEEATAKENLTVMGSQVDFFENKNWTILSNAFHIDPLIDKFERLTRYSYHEFPLSYTSIPTCYSNNVDMRVQPNPEPDHDLIYIGSGHRKAHRRKKLEKFYRHEDLDVGVIGRGWGAEEDDRGDYRHPEIHYYGVVGDHGDSYDLYNRGLACVQIADELFEETKNMTTRPVTAARGGSLMLVDKDVASGYYLDEQFQVSSREDVLNWVNDFKSMSYEERVAVNESQLGQMPMYHDIVWEDVLTYEEGRTFVDERGVNPIGVVQ